MTALAFDAGRVVRRRVVSTGELPYYFTKMAAGAHGVYASTSVIRRFTSTPDEILRIDPVSLRVLARRSLPTSSTAGLVVGPAGVYVGGPGTVLRLDPLTLHTLARYARPAGEVVPQGEDSFSSLSFAGGRLWVAFGDASSGSIFRLDPLTLRPSSGSWPAAHEQSYAGVVATSDGAWRNGLSSAARLLPDGRVGPTVHLAGSLTDAVADGDAELGLIDSRFLVRVASSGAVSVVPHAGSSCGLISSTRQVAWLWCAEGPVEVPLP
jgi:hypothetical protein